MKRVVLLYGGLSVGCAVAAPAPEQGAMTWLNGLLLVLSVLMVALLLGLAWRCWAAAGATADAQAGFFGRIAAAVYGLSAGSVLAIGLPTLMLPPCV